MENLVIILRFWGIVILIIIGLFVAWWVIASFIMAIKGRKSKVYWDAESGQIKNKKGECLFDKAVDKARSNEVAILMEKVMALGSRVETAVVRGTSEVDNLTRQLQCSVKGHGKWVYQGPAFTKTAGDHRFKCDICGLEITKTKDELTKAQKSAMTILDIK